MVILGDFNVHNPNWLPFSSPICDAAGTEAEVFALTNNLEQLIADATRVPDRSGDRANTLDLFLTTAPSLYSSPSVTAPIGNSDHCLISLGHTILSVYVLHHLVHE